MSISIPKIHENKISHCTNIEQIMGYEGNAARQYFAALSKMIKEDFDYIIDALRSI